MSSVLDAPPVAADRPVDDERSLLVRFGLLLDREEAAIVAHDAVAIGAAAEERGLLTQRLGEAARKRRAGPPMDAAAEAELIEMYRSLRQRHDVRSQVLRRHTEHHRRALGVLAQASGDAGTYKADGTVALQFVSF